MQGEKPRRWTYPDRQPHGFPTKTRTRHHTSLPAPSPAAPSARPSTSRRRGDTDTLKLLTLGYRQELEREFTLFNCFGCSFTALSSLTALGGSYYIGLMYGGPVVMMWGWLVVTLFTTSVGLSMAELASAYPTSGALYYWSFCLAPRRLRTLACWLTGWVLTLGQAAFSASNFYTFVHLVCAAVQVQWAVEVSSLQRFLLLLGSLALVGALNCGSARLTAYMITLGTMWHIVGLAAFCVTVVAVAPERHSGEYIFTSWQPHHSDTGISSPVYVTLVGLLMAQWTLTGYDGSAHLAEETYHAEVNVPRAILLTIAGVSASGYAFILALTSVRFNVEDVFDINNETRGSNVVLQICIDVIKAHSRTQGLPASVGGGVALFTIPIIGTFFCSYQSIANNSRMLYAFARDNGVPLSSWAKRVSPSTRAPVAGVAYMLLLTCLLAAPMCFHSFVFPAVASFSVVGCYVAYALPVLCKLSTGRRYFLAGPFSLGNRWSYVNNIISLAWVLTVTVIFTLPQLYPINLINMNWSAPILGLAIAFSLGWYYFPRYGAKNWFLGPRANLGQFHDVLPSQLAQIASEQEAKHAAEAEAAAAAAAVTLPPFSTTPTAAHATPATGTESPHEDRVAHLSYPQVQASADATIPISPIPAVPAATAANMAADATTAGGGPTGGTAANASFSTAVPVTFEASWVRGADVGVGAGVGVCGDSSLDTDVHTGVVQVEQPHGSTGLNVGSGSRYNTGNRPHSLPQVIHPTFPTGRDHGGGVVSDAVARQSAGIALFDGPLSYGTHIAHLLLGSNLLDEAEEEVEREMQVTGRSRRYDRQYNSSHTSLRNKVALPTAAADGGGQTVSGGGGIWTRSLPWLRSSQSPMLGRANQPVRAGRGTDPSVSGAVNATSHGDAGGGTRQQRLHSRRTVDGFLSFTAMDQETPRRAKMAAATAVGGGGETSSNGLLQRSDCGEGQASRTRLHRTSVSVLGMRLEATHAEALTQPQQGRANQNRQCTGAGPSISGAVPLSQAVTATDIHSLLTTATASGGAGRMHGTPAPTPASPLQRQLSPTPKSATDMEVTRCNSVPLALQHLLISGGLNGERSYIDALLARASFHEDSGDGGDNDEMTRSRLSLPLVDGRSNNNGQHPVGVSGSSSGCSSNRLTPHSHSSRLQLTTGSYQMWAMHAPMTQPPLHWPPLLTTQPARTRGPSLNPVGRNQSRGNTGVSLASAAVVTTAGKVEAAGEEEAGGIIVLEQGRAVSG